MKIIAYAICWNEEVMLPYYLRHYEKICDKIIIYDNMSTDKSQDIIKNHPLCELRTYDSGSQVRDDLYLKIKNHAWKECRGKGVDYVIVGDIDELVYHEDIKGFLEKNKKYSIFQPAGFEMAALKFPHTEGQIYSVCKRGLYHDNQCKKLVFSPDRVQEIAWFAGCHHNPKQKAKGPFWTYNKKNPAKSELKLLHFKYVDVDYVNKRHDAMAKRLSALNKKKGWGFHYARGHQYVKETVQRIYRTSQIIIR
tara:strand:- start:18238 stop:18990 length:753 start_codon:yes stop_codon:yes gene_type:complete